MNEINLIPTEMQNNNKIKFAKKKIILCFSFITIISFTILFSYQYLSLNNKLENIKQQKEQLKISMKNIENQKVKLNEINSEINVINSITRSSWGEKLLQINSKIVDGVFLSHVELKGNILSLKGFSYEFVSIGVLLNGIKNLYFIKLAELDSVIKTDSYGNEYFAFNILCKVE